MDTPQIIFLMLIGVGLGMHLVKHGEPRERYNFWVFSFAAGLEVALLYWGGFFK